MKAAAAYNLPVDEYPFTVELVDELGAVVWSQIVAGPGVLVVPGRGELGGTGRLTARLG